MLGSSVNKWVNSPDSFHIEYKARLTAFNSTEKYRSELDKLIEWMQPSGKILDYGCGTGYAVNHLRGLGFDAYGYDYYRYVEGDPEWYRTKFMFKFDHAYLLHSAAHIPDFTDAMERLSALLNYGAFVTIITPNRNYLNEIVNDKYVPDPTVIRHFNLPDIIAAMPERYKVVSCGHFGEMVNGISERIIIKFQMK